MPDQKADNHRRFGQVIRLRPECVDEYVRIHNPIPAPIAARIARSNIYDYSIFYDATTGLLFASFKYSGADFEADVAEMSADPETQKWWTVTDAMQVSLNEGSQGSRDEKISWWTGCTEVFRQA